MVSPLEQSVRDLDYPKGTITEIATAAAHVLGANKNTAIGYIFAKRKGFASYENYAKEKIMSRWGLSMSKYVIMITKKNHGSITNARTLTALKAGLNTYHEYKRKCKKKQRKFEQSQITNFNFRHRKKIPDSENPQEEIELREFIPKLLNYLNPKEKLILEQRYFQDKTLEEIGKENNLTYQRIEQIEKQSLAKLRELI